MNSVCFDDVLYERMSSHIKKFAWFNNSEVEILVVFLFIYYVKNDYLLLFHNFFDQLTQN